MACTATHAAQDSPAGKATYSCVDGRVFIGEKSKKGEEISRGQSEPSKGGKHDMKNSRQGMHRTRDAKIKRIERASIIRHEHRRTYRVVDTTASAQRPLGIRVQAFTESAASVHHGLEGSSGCGRHGCCRLLDWSLKKGVRLPAAAAAAAAASSALGVGCCCLCYYEYS